jgi:hypothetical protein
MMRTATVVAVLALLALGPACAGDECSENASECIDGQTIRWCSTSTHEWQEPESCVAPRPYCVRLDASAHLPYQTKGYCVSSPTKVEPCISSPDDVCTNDTRSACLGGYSVFEETCTNGCAGNACAP